jgi:sec-independent protein translocase protein TatC
MFVSAGLYKHERKYITYAVPFSASLFIAGAMFFLFYISPMILKAFFLFNKWFGQGQLQALVKINNHVTFMTNMMMVFGFCFQMPIAVLLLGKMGLVTVKSLGRYRRYVIVGILILAAFVTSPSPLDQIALAIPMWLLFELGVLLVYLLVDRKRRAEDAAMGYTDLDED